MRLTELTMRRRRTLGAADAPTDAAPTRDTVEAAYADYDREMSEAWRNTR